MKKITLMVAVLAMGLFFVSCNKEGQFTPKNQIDRVCYSESNKIEVYDNGYWNVQSSGNTSKYVKEIWNWDGKLLRSISHYNSDGDLRYTENYEYDGKRLVSISWGSASRYAFTYDKGKLSSIDGYEGTEKKSSYVFTHKSGKISQIAITNYDAKKGEISPLPVSALRFFIQSADMQSFIKVMAKIANRMNAKDIETLTVDLEWDGHNISKMIYLEGAYKETVEYKYDNKVNPYYGLFDISEYDGVQILSKNNVIRYTADDSENEHWECDYVYTYDGKVPTMQTSTYVQNYDEIYRYTDTEIYYYEYK